MIKQIVEIHRDMWIIRKGYIKTLKQTIEVFIDVCILRKEI